MEFDYIIDKINNAEIVSKPWPYATMNDFLKPEHLELLKNDWHSIDWAEHEDKKKEYVRSHEEPNWVRDYFSSQNQFLFSKILEMKKILMIIRFQILKLVKLHLNVFFVLTKI